ncbi:MAG TPA: TetR/AcrR family transcriptional regulator [Candidatus Onthocola gallistercoris]|uniref:TetR/AcrR family transcriptional regulator n=1 Tax=Candidatus Onthocola gallistercoris TaxID=2840876 RepID=A0A9D1HIC2_9FIRM|nr:TetR/AcrR family transcriptional regulator [Candidatus Onthocola gallistercoris]
MKDENKKTAITKAIIGLINEIGFANISMSKIAKATGISAATLYVYYKNKEDMFREVYLDVKKHMIEECGRNICPRENVQEAVRKLCKNLLRYMKEYTDEFLFIEQACNSPMATDEMLEELEQYNQNTISIFRRGVQEGILKQTSPALLISFCYYPIQQIFKEWRKEKSMLLDVDFEVVFQMCWDAIKR